MKEFKQIAKELSTGNVKKAAKLRKEVAPLPEDLRLELMEIAKQAIMTALKKGKIKEMREISTAFEIPKDLIEETVQQAVMSNFFEGDIEGVRALKDELPISRDLGVKIVSYCASWGRDDRTAMMQTVFS